MYRLILLIILAILIAPLDAEARKNVFSNDGDGTSSEIKRTDEILFEYLAKTNQLMTTLIQEKKQHNVLLQGISDQLKKEEVQLTAIATLLKAQTVSAAASPNAAAVPAAPVVVEQKVDMASERVIRLLTDLMQEQRYQNILLQNLVNATSQKPAAPSPAPAQ